MFSQKVRGNRAATKIFVNFLPQNRFTTYPLPPVGIPLTRKAVKLPQSGRVSHYIQLNKQGKRVERAKKLSPESPMVTPDTHISALSLSKLEV